MFNEPVLGLFEYSQLIITLDGIVCFSVRFCDNSLLRLKMRFQVFSFTSKKVQGFSSDRKILMSLLSVLFPLQNRVFIFWNFSFYSRYLGKRSLCPWNQPHFLDNSDKNFLSPERNKLSPPNWASSPPHVQPLMEICDPVLQTKGNNERQLKTIICQNKCFPEYTLYLFALQS